MKTIYLIDDDAFFTDTLKGILGDLGFSAKTFASAKQFEKHLRKPPPYAMIVDLAVPIGNSALISSSQAKGGHDTGITLLRLAKQSWFTTRLVLITGKPSNDARCWCEENEVEYLLKPISRSTLERCLGLRRLRAFIVHGRDQDAIDKIKSTLVDLNIEPIVLMEQQNRGRTVIEKFEKVSSSCDVAIIALSPEDIGRIAIDPTSKEKMRMRQNVLFELGYFCGSFGRTSGRVILIEFSDLDIPSDLAGVMIIDGTKDKDTLTNEIRAEISNIF